MNETKKLYDFDAYATEFDAVVQSCETVKDKQGDRYNIILDQTLFFPEEGGQSPDKGTIEEIEVLDVQITNGVIVHTIAKPLELGSKVKGKIDFTHRFNNMQQHSGEHIFSGIVHNRFGYDNVGFHLSDQVVTMDFNGVLTPSDIEKIEYAVNEAIINNLPIEVTYPTKEELARLEYRSKIEIEGQVRIVTIPGVDVCACCAPHVKRTGEIGMLKVLSSQNYKGGVRISILCGFRALKEYRKKTMVISQLSSMLSANQDSIVEAVEKLKDTNQALKAEVVAAKEESIRTRLQSIPSSQANVFLFEENLDASVMRTAVNQLVDSHAGISGILAGNDEEGYRFIIGSKEKDSRIVMDILKDKFNAKGGGSAAMVQGSVVATKEALMLVFDTI